MRAMTQKVQTNFIPPDLTSVEINEAAKALALHYKDGKLVCQSFFTPPHIGEINWLEGLEPQADLYFRKIHLIGTNLFHLKLVGRQEMVEKACLDPNFRKLLRGLSTTFEVKHFARRYFDASPQEQVWDVLFSLDKKDFFLLNFVEVEGKKMPIRNVTLVGDHLLGITEEGKAVKAFISADLLEQKGMALQAKFMEEVNKWGPIDMLSPEPNSKDFFLATTGNKIFQFNIWGDVIPFQALDGVKKVFSIDFNHTKTIFATDNGLFEVGVQELPNMLQTTGLPRRIAHPFLKEGFKSAHYVEDPFILGVHPSMGIFAKTAQDRFLCF